MRSDRAEFSKVIGERLRFARRRCGLTQADLAREGQLTVPQISTIENGGRMPSLPNLAYLCQALDVSADKLLFGGEFRDDWGWLDRLCAQARPLPPSRRELLFGIVRLLRDTPEV